MLLSSSKNDFLHPRDRQETLSLLQALPLATPATHEESLLLIENHRLMGLGLGYVDVHLLAAALLTVVPLWTDDKISGTLQSVSESLIKTCKLIVI